MGELGLAKTGFRSVAFMSLVKKCVLELDFVWERAFTVQRRSVLWLWRTDTYERFISAEKLQANVFVCSWCEVLGGFQCLSELGYPFGRASLILSCPLTGDSSFLALLVELFCWHKPHSSSIVLNAFPSSAMLKTAGDVELSLWWRLVLSSWSGGWITARWSQRRNSHDFSTSSVQGQGERDWFWLVGKI